MTRRRIAFCTLVLALAVLIPLGGDAQQAPFYVLDGFGGVHAGGGAPVIAPGTPYFGFDVAKDIAYVPGALGEGYLVVDGFGGVHEAGALAAVTPTIPYFGFDIARGISYRNIPPRANGNFNTLSWTVTSGTFTSIVSTIVNAPDDGYILLISNAEMFCSVVDTGGARTDVAIGIDSATVPLAGFDYLLTIPDCSLVTAGAYERRIVAVSNLFSVSAGAHTAHLLAKDGAGPIQGVLSDITITAIYIDQGFDGMSRPTGRVGELDPPRLAGPEGVIGR